MSSETKVVFPVEEFLEDADGRLGRANGNMYLRIPGIPNVHDGQILVRLKKKRFVCLDYGIVPTLNDVSAASVTRHINCPSGAGKQKCSTPTCPKVGVPVLLFDSEPDETSPLYLRSGLCFTCQRNLNEKRRTQRKRKGEEDEEDDRRVSVSTSAKKKTQGDNAEFKRFKINDSILDLNPDAIIINGPLEGTKRFQEPGYEYADIAVDIQACLEESTSDLQQLLLISSSETPATVTVEQNSDIVRSYEKAFLSLSKTIFLVNQWKASWDSVFQRDNINMVTAAVSAEDHAAFYGRDFADVVANAAAAAVVAQSEEDIANILSASNHKSAKSEDTSEGEETNVLGVAV